MGIGGAEGLHKQLREPLSARGDLEALRGLEQGTLRLGSFPTASASLLAEGLKIVHQRCPAIEIQVRSALRPQLIDMLHTSEVELALMWSYSWTEATEQSLSLVPVATDRTVLRVAADSPLGKVVSLPALRDLRWIIRHGQHPASEVLSRSCESAGFAPHVVYGASDYQELHAMVAAGSASRWCPGWPPPTTAPTCGSCPSPLRTGSRPARSPSPP